MKSFKKFLAEMELPFGPKILRGKISGKPMVGDVVKEKVNLYTMNKVSYTIDALLEYCIVPFEKLVDDTEYNFTRAYSAFVNLNKTCQSIKTKATSIWNMMIQSGEGKKKSWFGKSEEKPKQDYSEDNLPNYLDTNFQFKSFDKTESTIKNTFNRLNGILFGIGIGKGWSGTPDYMSPEWINKDDKGHLLEDFRELLSALYSDDSDQIRQMAKSLGLAWDNFVKEWEEFAKLFR